MAAPAVLIFNPRAGRWAVPSLVDPVVGVLAERWPDMRVWPTEAPRHATGLAERAADEGAAAVFSFGGDGTLREVAAGLLGRETPLGVLPGGTVNVVARAFAIPPRPLAAARALVTAKQRRVDVGMCGDEPFLMQVSGPLDATVLRRVSPRAKRWLGGLAVVAAGVATWLGERPQSLSLTADGHPVEATFFAVCNLPLYAGRYRLAPEAEPDDGRLDLVLFRGDSRRAMLSFAWDLARGVHVRRADTTFLRVESAALPAGLVQIDGDTLEIGPSRIWLAPSSLRILAP